MSVVNSSELLGSLRAKTKSIRERARRRAVLFQSILLTMSAPERHVNVRVHVSKNLQQCNYPRGALIMVAGAGGGNWQNLNLL